MTVTWNFVHLTAAGGLLERAGNHPDDPELAWWITSSSGPDSAGPAPARPNCSSRRFSQRPTKAAKPVAAADRAAVCPMSADGVAPASDRALPIRVADAFERMQATDLLAERRAGQVDGGGLSSR